MKVLFLDGWHSVPGGVKPTYLAYLLKVLNPDLDDDDFVAVVATAQQEFDKHQPQVVVGSSRGGAVAMNINSGDAWLVLLWGIVGDTRSENQLRSKEVRMPRVSAGLLMYRIREKGLQVLLAHPGGPFFANKDEGSWTIPKGEIEPGEELLEAAKREFQEETSVIPTGSFIALSPIQQKGGKIVHAWAFEGDCDPTAVVSNTFTMEWPPKSGRQMAFPEMDRAEFFGWLPQRRRLRQPNAH